MSEVRKKILEVLANWDYTKRRASPFWIARAVGASVNYVCQVLRELEAEGLVRKTKAGRETSWYLV